MLDVFTSQSNLVARDFSTRETAPIFIIIGLSALLQPTYHQITYMTKYAYCPLYKSIKDMIYFSTCVEKSGKDRGIKINEQIQRLSAGWS
jgi:hypothetical protein